MTHRHALDQALRKIATGQEQVVSIRNFFDASPLAEKLLDLLHSIESEKSQSEIYKTPEIPLYNASNADDLRKKLLEYGLNREIDGDESFYPLVSPITFFWRMMDAVWPHGAERLMWMGRRVPFGLYRLWNEGSAALPHQDVLRREIPRHPKAQQFSVQMGVNLYLMTGSGGELDVWDRKVTDEEWTELGLIGSYGYQQSWLGDPKKTIAPSSGDLVLLNTEYVHSVRPVLSGRRVTQSGFIGYIDDNSPLTCWS